jgi:uncharacterized protein (TIGR03118 family)
MKSRVGRDRLRTSAAVLAIVGLAIAAEAPIAGAAAGNAYVVNNLVSNVSGAAARVDPNLVNAWGLTASAGSPWWVADNGTNVSTLYPANGTINTRVVQVPIHPTGTVFWGSTRATFVFATEAGTIRGWLSPTNNSFILADRSDQGAIYKGLALAATAEGDRFYATDFHNARVDVFDGSFNLISNPGAFTDPQLRDGYAPFGIQTIGSRIFVTYAKQDAEATDELHGQSLGFVDAYDTSGNLLARVAQHGQLNAPWGLALAPADFGRFSGDLLVGNFGDGQINAYEELPNGHFEHRGELRTADGKSLTIDGLWALQFGHGSSANGPTSTLFFTAGPNDESDGLFGTITAE